jgi:hypothetical protein
MARCDYQSVIALAGRKDYIQMLHMDGAHPQQRGRYVMYYG